MGTMGGYGSGPRSGRPTVESALSLDVDYMIRRGAIRANAHVGSEIRFSLYDDEIIVHPAVYPFRFFRERGGLLSCGNDLVDISEKKRDIRHS
jgi:hypothetical protein